MTEAVTQPMAKRDPETLAIRSRPPRAIRFKRGLIVMIAAVGSVSLITVTWVALRPRLFQIGDDRQELSQPNARPSADIFGKVPATYSDVPKLGPPLPGDLGKPILESQHGPMTATSVGDQQRQVEATARERRLAELKSARESGLLVQQRQGGADLEHTNAPSGTEVDASADTTKVSLDLANDPNAQGRKEAFVTKPERQSDIDPHALTPLTSPQTLSAGSVIAASLITGVRSDLPGLVTAQVTENTYDSATGRILLIPQGARLVGTYDSVVAFGQKRALVVWQRIIMPDGSSLRIDNVPATDPSGYAGLADKIDLHTWQLLKGVALSTLLAVGSELALSGQGDLVQAIRMSTQDSASRAGDQLTQRNLGVQPTITIRPGTPVRLVVHKDLVIMPTEAP